MPSLSDIRYPTVKIRAFKGNPTINITTESGGFTLMYFPKQELWNGCMQDRVFKHAVTFLREEDVRPLAQRIVGGIGAGRIAL